MLEINIDHRGELYRDNQVFRLIINGTVMIDGEYPAQGLHDFASLIASESQRVTGHGGLCPALTGAPSTAAEFAQDERKRAAYRRASETRNAARELKPAEARVAVPLHALEDRPIWSGAAKNARISRKPSLWSRAAEFLRGWIA